MLRSGQGLRHISSADLKRLLQAIHRGEIECPINQIALAQLNLLRLGDELGHLRGLDARAAQAVIVAALAERR
jgi:hypothetical protein